MEYINADRLIDLVIRNPDCVVLIAMMITADKGEVTDVTSKTIDVQKFEKDYDEAKRKLLTEEGLIKKVSLIINLICLTIAKELERIELFPDLKLAGDISDSKDTDWESFIKRSMGDTSEEGKQNTQTGS
jgi:hypothetical protein